MNKLLLSLLMMSVLMVGCAKEDEDTIDDSGYKSCFVVDQGVNICYDLSDSGATHSEVALSCETFSGTSSADVCPASFEGVGSVGLCTGLTLTDGGSVNFANVKARYYIAANAQTAQQSACQGESGTWNAGE